MRYLLILSVLLWGSACEKLFIPEEQDNTHQNNFDLLWKTMDEKYCFFTYKGVHWDELYDQYSVQVDNEMSDFAFFNLCASMLNELKDGHVNLWAPFNTYRYWDWFLNYPQNFNETIVERTYLKRNFLMAGGLKVQLLRDSVGYIRYESFMNVISGSFLDFSLALFNQETKGLIIDIRNNGGGYVHVVDTLVSRFIPGDEEMLVGYRQFKNGPGHDDFSPMEAKIIQGKGTYYKHPVVLLTNRSCYSAANLLANYMSAIPEVILMGDQTGGGSGEPIGYEMRNGWVLRLSAHPTLNVNKEHIEFGIYPDLRTDMHPDDEAKQIDTMIEDAISFLNTL